MASIWTLPSVTAGSFAYESIRFEPSKDISAFLTFDPEKRTISFDGSEFSHYLGTSSHSVSFYLMDSEGLESGPTTQVINLVDDRPAECSQALVSKMDKSAIEVVKEYEPAIYFPQVLFTGPHTHVDYPCKGTYT